MVREWERNDSRRDDRILWQPLPFCPIQQSLSSSCSSFLLVSISLSLSSSHSLLDTSISIPSISVSVPSLSLHLRRLYPSLLQIPLISLLLLLIITVLLFLFRRLFSLPSSLLFTLHLLLCPPSIDYSPSRFFFCFFFLSIHLPPLTLLSYSSLSIILTIPSEGTRGLFFHHLIFFSFQLVHVPSHSNEWHLIHRRRFSLVLSGLTEWETILPMDLPHLPDLLYL